MLPVLEALGRHRRWANAAELRAHAGELAAMLVTPLPKPALRLGEIAPSHPLPPEQARLRLYEAVGTFLATIAAAQPLVVMLDDLQ